MGGFFFYFFIFLQRHDRGQNEQRSWKYGNMEIWKYGNMEIWKYGNMEMASTDMQGECERRNIDIGD